MDGLEAAENAGKGFAPVGERAFAALSEVQL